MPEFIPEHTPVDAGTDDFTTAYLDCAEWLLGFNGVVELVPCT